MSKKDGAMILAQALKNEGVDKIFTLTGGHIYRVYQEAEKLGIDVVDCRHEGAAAYAAEGYALATGKPGVVILTAGPGVTNAMTQVADCMLGNVPVLFIGGASSTEHDLTEVLQEYDTLTMMKPNTVWSIEVQETHRIAEHIAVAFRNMMGGVPGPVYVEIPMDVLEVRKVDEETVKYPARSRTHARIFGDPAEVEKAADLLVNAQKPAMIIGDGAQFNCKNFGVFRELAEYLQMPTDISITNSGRFFNDDIPLLQVGGLGAAQADVLLLLSHKPNLAALDGLSANAKLINVHRNHQHVGLNIPLDVGIIGYADAVAEQILDAVKARTKKIDSRPWIDELVNQREATAKILEPLMNNEAIPMHPARVAADVIRFLNNPDGQEYCYVCDGGDSVTWPLILKSFLGLRYNFPGRLFFSSYIGCVGASWGTLNGLYQALGRPILHSIGDGSFGQYIGELFTFAKFKIPYVCVIFNDGNWGMIKAFSMYDVPEENHDIGALIKCGDGYFHYEAIAAAWGGYGICVKEPDKIIPAIQQACEAAKGGKPAIVNCLLECKKEFYSPATVGLYTQLSNPAKIRY
jgi:acetolactate synthase-1/2/3 large subunit